LDVNFGGYGLDLEGMGGSWAGFGGSGGYELITSVFGFWFLDFGMWFVV